MARETSMHAVRFHEYGPPSVLVVDEVERPEPAAGEVLIRVHIAGVNPIDWKFRAGYLKDYVPLTLPHTPGLDLAGTVKALGDGVTGFAIGDRVFGRGAGTYAEFAVAPATTIARIPEGVSFEQAAPLHVGGETAWVGLFDTAHLEPGQRLLVQGGAGGVGSIAVQLGHWKGAYVIATASAANVEFVRSLGADEVIDYTSVNVEDAVHDVDVSWTPSAARSQPTPGACSSRRASSWRLPACPTLKPPPHTAFARRVSPILPRPAQSWSNLPSLSRPAT